MPALCRDGIRDPGLVLAPVRAAGRSPSSIRYSALEAPRLRLALRVRPPEDQLFIRVSSNRPWQEVAAQPVLRQFFGNLEPLGL
jgi:hypothetical protein